MEADHQNNNNINNHQTKLIHLKPPPTPITLDGDRSRGLQPITHHPIHGNLQQAPSISLRNQSVLEEDQYIQALSHIIKRDFFPCLDRFESLSSSSSSSSLASDHHHHPHPSRTRSDQPSSSLASDHPRWEDGAQTPKISSALSPGMTPLGLSNSSSDPHLSTITTSTSSFDPIQSNPTSYDQSLSLDQFCARYTSEDNSSFSEILNNSNRLKRIKYSWAFDSSSNHNARLLESTLKREHLIATIGKMANGTHRIGLIEGISGKPGERKMVENVITKEDRLAIQASNDPDRITASQPSTQTDTDPSSNRPSVTKIDLITDRHLQSVRNPDSWPHVTRNALMFAPDANTCSHQPPQPPPFPAQPPVLLGSPKSINHANTRISNDELLQSALSRSRLSSRHSHSTLSPTRTQILAALSGNPNGPSSSPRVNGFSFVEELPTPNLESMKSSSELDRLMTWGEIMTTPLRIDAPDSNEDHAGREEELVEEGPFRISKRPRREELAIGMARKASKSLREKYGPRSTGLGIGNGFGNHGRRTNASQLRRSLLGDLSTRDSPRDRSHRTVSSPYPHTPRREEFLSPAGKVLLRKTGGTAGSLQPSTPKKTPSQLIKNLGGSTPRAGIFTPVLKEP